MKFISKECIEIDRELSDLDIFTLDFVKILRKYTPYVIISGYVSILLGRSRASEDVDIIFPGLQPELFKSLLKELYEKGFECINTSKPEEYFNENLAVRFARKNTAIPNIELKEADKKIDFIALEKSIKVVLKNEELFISNLELQIAFKEKVLGSTKDFEDARHI